MKLILQSPIRVTCIVTDCGVLNLKRKGQYIQKEYPKFDSKKQKKKKNNPTSNSSYINFESK